MSGAGGLRENFVLATLDLRYNRVGQEGREALQSLRESGDHGLRGGSPPRDLALMF